jgi:hypothetical protein
VSKKTNTTPTASIELAGDAAQLVAALERLQAGGFTVEAMTVGAVSVKLHRAAAALDQQDRADERPGLPGVYNQFGSEVLKQVAAEVLPGVDLQPVIGRNG